MSTPTPPVTRPTVEQVAVLIRARTKDSNGIEVGTFDGDTRPTSRQVEQVIDASEALVGMQLPTPENLPAALAPAVVQVVALEAACRIEKTYWPEQVQSERSAYAFLKVEYDEALAALKAAVEQGGTSGFGGQDISVVPVASWTSIPHDWI